MSWDDYINEETEHICEEHGFAPGAFLPRNLFEEALMGAKYNYRKSDDWKTAKKIIFHNIGRKCRICKKLENIELHHIKYTVDDEDSHDKYKIPLCNSCHKNVHIVRKQSLVDKNVVDAWLMSLQEDEYCYSYEDIPEHFEEIMPKIGNKIMNMCCDAPGNKPAVYHEEQLKLV